MDDATAINPHIGSSFQDYLEAEGLRAEVDSAALRDLADWLIANEAKKPPRPR